MDTWQLNKSSSISIHPRLHPKGSHSLKLGERKSCGGIFPAQFRVIKVHWCIINMQLNWNGFSPKSMFQIHGKGEPEPTSVKEKCHQPFFLLPAQFQWCQTDSIPTYLSGNKNGIPLPLFLEFFIHSTIYSGKIKHGINVKPAQLIFLFSMDFTDALWTPTSWDSTFLFLHEQNCHKSWFISSRQMKCDLGSRMPAPLVSFRCFRCAPVTF